MLIVLERIFYLHLELKGNIALLNSLIKAATLKKDLNSTKNAGAFIIALLGCFKICLFNHKINLSTELISSTQAIQEFFIEQIVWNENDPVAILVHGLLFLKELRILYKNKSEIHPVIDYYAARFCDIAMHDILRVYPYYSINLIKEDIGSSYVKY